MVVRRSMCCLVNTIMLCTTRFVVSGEPTELICIFFNSQMSISFLNKLNEVDDYDDFVQQFINLSSIDKGVGVGSYVGGDGFNATSNYEID